MHYVYRLKLLIKTRYFITPSSFEDEINLNKQDIAN
jgi:hypothetical protein